MWRMSPRPEGVVTPSKWPPARMPIFYGNSSSDSLIWVCARRVGGFCAAIPLVLTGFKLKFGTACACGSARGYNFEYSKKIVKKGILAPKRWNYQNRGFWIEMNKSWLQHAQWGARDVVQLWKVEIWKFRKKIEIFDFSKIENFSRRIV